MSDHTDDCEIVREWWDPYSLCSCGFNSFEMELRDNYAKQHSGNFYKSILQRKRVWRETSNVFKRLFRR